MFALTEKNFFFLATEFVLYSGFMQLMLLVIKQLNIITVLIKQVLGLPSMKSKNLRDVEKVTSLKDFHNVSMPLDIMV